MDDLTAKAMEQALCAIADMADRTEKAKEKFARGTSQHTLLTNRLKALHIAASLIARRQAKESIMACYAEGELKHAFAPIVSLIHKSEKAQTKLAPGTWQHAMLARNLKALHIALPLLTEALGGKNGGGVE